MSAERLAEATSPEVEAQRGGVGRRRCSCRSARPSSTGRTCRSAPTRRSPSPSPRERRPRSRARSSPRPCPTGRAGSTRASPGPSRSARQATELVLVELGRSATETFDRVLFVNAHGGNAAPLAAAVRLLREESRDVRAWSPRFGGDAHAGRTETSLMLALEAGCRATELAEPGQHGAARRADRRPARRRRPRRLAERRARRPDRRLGGGGTGAARRRDRGPARDARRLAGDRAGRRRSRAMSGVAIVTGAGRGIGAATVAALAAEGRRVVAVDRGADDPRLPYAMASAADLDAVVAAANEAAGEERVRAELADATDAAAMAARGRARRGVGRGRGHGRQRRRDRRRRARLGAARRTRRTRSSTSACAASWSPPGSAIPALLRRPEPRAGRFVATASAASLRGLPGLAAYCAAKAGVSGFVRALADRPPRHRHHRRRRRPRLDRHPDPRRERPPLRPRGRPRLRRPAADRAPDRPRRDRRHDRLPLRPGRRRRSPARPSRSTAASRSKAWRPPYLRAPPHA